MKAWLRGNWFLAGLLTAVGLAFLWPEPAASGGWLRTESTTLLSVAMLFFIRGLLLPLRELRDGILQWRLHTVVHALVFLAAPLLVWGLLRAMEWWFEVDPVVEAGFFLLAVMPTTIATAAAFTALAGGNTAAAVFNATSTNLLGVVIVPLWMGWFLAVSAVPFSVLPVMAQVALLVVVPLVLGQAVKPALPPLASFWRQRLEILAGCLVLFVLLAAFSNAVRSGLFMEQRPSLLLVLFLGSALLFALMSGLAWGAAKWARFSHPDAICLLFCGSQKTLAAGVPLANLMFPGDPALSLLLLPLVFYHFLQLFTGGILVDAMKGKRGLAK